ncbi:hypothetical protein CVO74_19550 [Xanthomonas prunicola]|uniref:Uncharacterized protein n=2 Tax=Xanthomonas prunicola TaxID=2053930 RepID=A0A2N3REA7_9XANT|nr:hypothetical protein XpruCFBP8353_21115 [Xanthomonas prunicola]PKV15130.1 hypothetical protein XpruCFBP8354_21405 [Xanthomonas prunicola]PKV19693.1 hypothetical protein CVO74_19550 [Xanthomonas prunicola]
MGRFGIPSFKKKIADAAASGEERYVTEADIEEFAHDIVVFNFERLRVDSSLTGEWLIFAKYNEENYYLSLGKHDTGDELIRSQIDVFCLCEFPFLESILAI